MDATNLIENAYAFTNDCITPILVKEPRLTAPIENYDFLLRFSSHLGGNGDKLVADALARQEQRINIFAYVPQCNYHCSFCPYPVTLDGKWAEDSDRLAREAETFASIYPLNNRPIETFNIGGGTPGLMSSSSIYKLVSRYKGMFNINNTTSITFETSPDSLTPEKMAALQISGVNRVSMGIQTFDEGTLGESKRGHSASQAEQSLRLLLTGGFRDVNIDLIRGFPGQSIKQFVDDISRAVSIGATSLHIYRMRLPQSHKMRKGSQCLPENKEPGEIFAMQVAAHRLLNSCGYDCHHTSHWKRSPSGKRLMVGNWDQDKTVFGFGWRAFSYMPEGESNNEAILIRWRHRVDAGIAATFGRVSEYTEIEKQSKWLKFSLKSLSIDCSEFSLRFGISLEQSVFWGVISRLIEIGVLDQTSGNITFTEPGFILAEEAIQFMDMFPIVT